MNLRTIKANNTKLKKRLENIDVHFLGLPTPLPSRGETIGELLTSATKIPDYQKELDAVLDDNNALIAQCNHDVSQAETNAKQLLDCYKILKSDAQTTENTTLSKAGIFLKNASLNNIEVNAIQRVENNLHEDLEQISALMDSQIYRSKKLCSALKNAMLSNEEKYLSKFVNQLDGYKQTSTQARIDKITKQAIVEKSKHVRLFLNKNTRKTPRTMPSAFTKSAEGLL